jgi:hypothetical protein
MRSTRGASVPSMAATPRAAEQEHALDARELGRASTTRSAAARPGGEHSTTRARPRAQESRT